MQHKNRSWYSEWHESSLALAEGLVDFQGKCFCTGFRFRQLYFLNDSASAENRRFAVCIDDFYWETMRDCGLVVTGRPNYHGVRQIGEIDIDGLSVGEVHEEIEDLLNGDQIQNTICVVSDGRINVQRFRVKCQLCSNASDRRARTS